MDILYKFGRFWTVLCPIALLTLTFKYSHQFNSILNSIEGMSFRKTLVVLFIAFFALWSLLHMSSMLFVRVVSWIWSGGKSYSEEKSQLSDIKEIEEPFKDNIDYHNTMEQENLFKLDLQGESIDSLAEEK